MKPRAIPPVPQNRSITLPPYLQPIAEDGSDRRKSPVLRIWVILAGQNHEEGRQQQYQRDSPLHGDVAVGWLALGLRHCTLLSIDGELTCSVLIVALTKTRSQMLFRTIPCPED
jgi:hypothetical protein